MFAKKVKTIVTIEGMHCEHCANKVTETLSKLDNVEKVKVNLKKKEALITSKESISFDDVKKAISSIDFEVTNITEK